MKSLHKGLYISPVSLICSDNCEQAFLCALSDNDYTAAASRLCGDRRTCVPRPWYNLCYDRRTFAVQAEIGVNEHLESLFFAKKESRAS